MIDSTIIKIKDEILSTEKNYLKSEPRTTQIQSLYSAFICISYLFIASSVLHNIANVIAAYTLVCRFYDGDHLSYKLEAVDMLLAICENFKSHTNFDTIHSAVESVVGNLHKNKLFFDINTKKTIFEDIECIFNGPCDDGHTLYILSSLSDIKYLLKSVESLIVPSIEEFLPNSISSGPRKEATQFCYRNHIKKLDLFMSFIKYRYNKFDCPVLQKE